MDQKKPLSYYRVKTECTVENENCALEKKKIEELVLASCYTEAETLLYAITEALNRTRFGSISYEIIKTKISDVVFNEVLTQDEPIKDFAVNCFSEDETSGVGLYSVKVIFFTIDEKSAKEKQTVETLYIPAESNADATERIEKHLKDTMSDFVIRDVKFDKAEAIYWPLEAQKEKTEKFTLG